MGGLVGGQSSARYAGLGFPGRRKRAGYWPTIHTRKESEGGELCREVIYPGNNDMVQGMGRKRTGGDYSSCPKSNRVRYEVLSCDCDE